MDGRQRPALSCSKLFSEREDFCCWRPRSLSCTMNRNIRFLLFFVMESIGGGGVIDSLFCFIFSWQQQQEQQGWTTGGGLAWRGGTCPGHDCVDDAVHNCLLIDRLACMPRPSLYYVLKDLLLLLLLRLLYFCTCTTAVYLSYTLS